MFRCRVYIYDVRTSDETAGLRMENKLGIYIEMLGIVIKFMRTMLFLINGVMDE